MQSLSARPLRQSSFILQLNLQKNFEANLNLSIHARSVEEPDSARVAVYKFCSEASGEKQRRTIERKSISSTRVKFSEISFRCEALASSI